MKSLLWSSFGVAAALADQFSPDSYKSSNVITRDIVVVGGGSSGTYAAINLLDLNQTVVVVEKESILGGHTNTYTDPSTGTKIDFGVQTYANYSAVRDFFARFDIPTTEFSFEAAAIVYADFETGKAVSNFTPSYDFAAYGAQLAKYPYTVTSWTLPNPVPEDLLLPFGDFLKKYNLQDIAFTIWSNAWGSGDILKQPTVYMLKAIDAPFLKGLTEGTVTTAHKNNHELYDKATEELGTSALVSSTVIAGKRSADGVRLVVQTPNGKKLIVASKAIVSIPPKIENMSPFGLDTREKNVFNKFGNSAFYVALVTDTGLPDGTRFQNVVLNEATFNIPTLPAPYHVSPTAIDGIFAVWWGGPKAASEADVKADISTTIKRLREVHGDSTDEKEVKFLDFGSHTPFQLVVPTESIKNGFYGDLEGLQGYKNTWYTGAAFLSHHAGQLWNFTQALLPEVVAA